MTRTITLLLLGVLELGSTMPARALVPAEDVPRLWILASDGAVRHRDMVKPAMDSIIALGTEAIPYLLPYLHTEDARERHAITDIFKGIGSPAVPALVEVLGSGGQYHTTNTLNALGKIGDPAATPAAVPFLNDQRYDVRAMAAETIGKTAGSGAERALRNAVGDTVEVVRKSAVVALGRLGRTSSADVLLTLLHDSWYGVRYAAAAALANIDSGGMAIGALRDHAGRERALLLNALVDAHVPNAGRWAPPYLDDSDYVVRAAAARALVNEPAKDETSRRTERQRADDNNPLVRYFLSGGPASH